MARIRSLMAIAMVIFMNLGLLFFGVSAAEAAPGTTATIKVGGRGTHVRSSLDVTSDTNIVGGLHNGDTVTVYCVATGPTVTGPHGTTNTWSRIGTRRWVNSTFTGVKGPPCFNKQTQPAKTMGSGARVNVNGPARVRSQPSTSAAIEHRYADGTPIKLSCQTFAEDRSWVKLASGAGYIASELVSGIPPMIKLCPADRTPASPEPLIMMVSKTSDSTYVCKVRIEWNGKDANERPCPPGSPTLHYYRKFDLKMICDTLERPADVYSIVTGSDEFLRNSKHGKPGFFSKEGREALSKKIKRLNGRGSIPAMALAVSCLSDPDPEYIPRENYAPGPDWLRGGTSRNPEDDIA